MSEDRFIMGGSETTSSERRVVLPDEENARRVLDRYVELYGEPPARQREALYLISSFSNFLGRAILRDPELLAWVVRDEQLEGAKPRHAALGDVHTIVEHASTPQELFSRLRRYKYRELARIVLRDIVGRTTFADTMRELSVLASSIIDGACSYLSDALGARGRGRFAVVGMGKLGGWELNLSSDVDIVYFYRDAPSPEVFFKLAEQLTRSLSAITEEGFLYRVDLGLRPGGTRSPIAVSADWALDHYFYWGDTWERAALIKACPVAGDIELGEEFCREIQPFVYRKHLDYSSIEDLKEMKTKLDRLHESRDVKMGKGGIREIEFFTQALQLVNGGAVKELRCQSTLEALTRLRGLGLLDEEKYELLREAYLFLRRVEHNLQLVDEVQTHKLPRGEAGLGRIARMTGFSSVSGFVAAYERHTSLVSELYDGLFHEPSRVVEEESREFWRLADFLTGGATEEEALAALAGMGFKNPAAALELIEVLLDPKRGSLTPKGRSLAKKVIPALLKRVITSRDPDAVLRNVERFVSSVGWRSSVYSVLYENPHILQLLAKLFSASGYLTSFLINHPEYLDLIALKTVRREHRTRQEMLDELKEALRQESDYEEKLNVIRRFRNAETLKLCLRDLNNEVDPLYVGSYLSMLADAIVQAGVIVAGEGMGLDEEEVSRMVVLGMGKLGGEEMGYNSDLDIVFVYDGTEHERYSKLAQRLISVLSLTTIEGYAYKIDTRLRPSGRAGTLVSSLHSYTVYHEKKAALWERQALIKARPVAGRSELAEAVMRVVEHCVYEQPLEEGFYEEIDSMRRRMEREIARESDDKLNLKTGRGGMVDVEFLVQMLQLKYGRRHRSLRVQNTLRALDELYKWGVVDEAAHRVLREGLLFLRRLENRLRLLYNRSMNDLHPRDFADLASEMGTEGDGRRLKEEYLERTRAIRGVYERYVRAFEEGTLPAAE